MRLQQRNKRQDELRKLPELTKERIAAFIKKRNAGIYLKNLYDLQEAFELKPHEVERLKQMITFKLTNFLKFDHLQGKCPKRRWDVVQTVKQNSKNK